MAVGISGSWGGSSITSVSASHRISGNNLYIDMTSSNSGATRPRTLVNLYINGSRVYSTGYSDNFGGWPCANGSYTYGPVDISGWSSFTYQLKGNFGYNNEGQASSVATVQLWAKPGQIYVTKSANNSSGNVVNSGDQAIDSSWQYIRPAHESKSFAGDSFTFWWDKNNPGSMGNNAWPRSAAQLSVGGTNKHTAWVSHGDGDDRYDTYSVTIEEDWMGQNVYAYIRKEFHNSAGNIVGYDQAAGHYIQPKPTIDSDAQLRSKRFYTGTSSCAVWHLTKYNISSNGYGTRCSQTNIGSITGNTALSSEAVKLSLGAYGVGVAGEFWFGDKSFNGDYSTPSSPLDFHSLKFTPGTEAKSAIVFNWINIYNPRTGAEARLGYAEANEDTIQIVSGSVDLPVIDKISASSGNGTTIILENNKKIYTNQENVKITWKIDHSGNDHGWGYDIRSSGNSSNSACSPSKVIGRDGCNIMPAAGIDKWETPYGRLDANTTATVQHDAITESGVNRKVVVIPYITDNDGYKIFGEKTRSYVESPTYNMIKIKVPDVPTLDKWKNTLPAIDGVKDEIKWEATSPANWGNVTDFAYGYKLRYKIGNDTTKADGWQWSFIDTPTTTNTKFSGSFKQVYNRTSYTNCVGELSATNYYSTVWDGYLDFQSNFASKSYAIAAKDPYSATTGAVTTPKATTLLTEVPYEFQCPQEDINGNALIQTTKISIDGGTAEDITSPTYTTSTPDSLSGNLTLKFDKLKLSTRSLARGAHTIKITNEVATYFDSTTPVTNHVYFGTTTVTSNTLNVEVAELPKKPKLNTPNPQFHKAGAHRRISFTWTPDDWGCLDTTYNNRHFNYELIDPDGNVIMSAAGSKNDTSFNTNFLLVSPTHEGVYTFKIRQTTVVGSSDWAIQTIEIQKANEPSNSEIIATDVLALPNWQWNLKINPGNNGSYVKLPTTMPSTTFDFQTDKYLAGGIDNNPVAANFERSARIEMTLKSQNLSTKTSVIDWKFVMKDGLGLNQYAGGTISNQVDMTGSIVNLNGNNVYTQPAGNIDAYHDRVIKTGSITVNHNKDTSFGKTNFYNAMFTGDISANIGGTNVTGLLKGMALPATPDSRIEGRYKVELVLPTYIDNLIGTESYEVYENHNRVDIKDFANSKYTGDSIWYDYNDGSALTKDPIHEYEITTTLPKTRIFNLYENNGDFENGEVLQGTSGCIVTDPTNSYSGNHYLHIGTTCILDGAFSAGHKYYFRMMAQTSGSKTYTLDFDGEIITLNTNGNGTWRKINKIFELSGNSAKVTLSCEDWDSDSNIDSLILVDLTNTFGSSKEPDIETFEKLIDLDNIKYFEDLTVGGNNKYSIKIYDRKMNGYSVIKTITGWTTINNGVRLDRNYTTNLDGYENGLYKILVTYERNYTAKTVRETEYFDVIPPEVKIYNSSHIISCSETSDDIPFQLSVDVYAGTDIHEVEYSMDYGKTWSRLSVTRSDGAHRYFEKRLNLTWLDEIWIKAHGKNPVSEKTRSFYHEMPSDYKVWLSWNERKENKLTEDFYTVYEYNYDELEDLFSAGELKLTIDSSNKITNPHVYAGFIDAKTEEWVNMNSLNYSGVGTPDILANDGIHNTSITLTNALLDRRDIVFRIGFKADKGTIINDNITFIPRLVQGSKNNILDINKIFSEYKDRTLKYKYPNNKIAVTKGCCTVTNNKDNSFTITRETKPDTNFIRRLSMSYKGADTKKVRRIKKI